MASAISLLSGPDDFANGYYVDWASHPGQGALAPITQMDVMNNRYDFGDQMVTVDIAGPSVFFSVCNINFFNANFANGDSLLVGDNEAGMMPVHLFFDPPLRAVGTHISAAGPNGQNYLAQMSVRLHGSGAWKPVDNVLGKLTSLRNDSAPFIGAKGNAGNLISEAWFDVVDPGNRDLFSEVAINQLYFLPA